MNPSPLSETERTYNLLDAPWIPVVRRSGKRDWIAPHQLGETEDPPQQLATGRPDFDAAVVQFLIGLLQTIVPPEDEMEWAELLQEPLSPDELKKRFESIAGKGLEGGDATWRDCFWLDGAGPRFLQELDFMAAFRAKQESKGGAKKTSDGEEDMQELALPISSMFMEAKSITGNKDLFFKRDQLEALGAPALAMALLNHHLTGQTLTWGFRMGVRGGGPLTTLVTHQDGSLWQNVWLNVQSIEGAGNEWQTSASEPVSRIFPWMGKTRISSNDEIFAPQDGHATHVFWAMPQRIWIPIQPLDRRCDLFPTDCVSSASSFLQLQYGYNYKGAWQHPLSPTIPAKNGDRVLNARGGLPYRDWPQLTLPRPADSEDSAQPARVIGLFHRLHRRKVELVEAAPERLALWSFGFDLKNATTFCWYDRTTPLMEAEPEHLVALRIELARMIQGAAFILDLLLKVIKKAMKRRPEDIRSFDDTRQSIMNAFWALTEPTFFVHARVVLADLQKNTPGSPQHEARMLLWIRSLQKAARILFAQYAQELATFSAGEVRRIAEARNDLEKGTSPNNVFLRKAVGLPVEEKFREGTKKKGQEANP